MAGKSSGSKKGSRRQGKKSSGGVPPALIAVIAFAVLGGIGFGVYQLLLQDSQNSLQETVNSAVDSLPAIPETLGKPSSHDGFLKAIFEAEREHAKVCQAINDLATAQKSLPDYQATLMKKTGVVNDWLAFIEQHPFTGDEASQLFLTRSIELGKIRKEFPYDIAFGHKSDVLAELAKASEETGKSAAADMQLSKALNAANPAYQMLPQGPDENQRRLSERRLGNPAMSANGLSTQQGASIGTGSEAPASVVLSNTPPDQAPPDVPIPQTEMQAKYGDKAVSIRLEGISSPTALHVVSNQIFFALGGGDFKGSLPVSEGAQFMILGPIENFQQLVTQLEKFGKVLKVDESQKLIVLWVSPDKQSIPSSPGQPGGIPIGFPSSPGQ